MEAASTSETSVNFYQTTRRNNPEDSHLHTRRRVNLKSHFSACLTTVMRCAIDAKEQNKEVGTVHNLFQKSLGIFIIYVLSLIPFFFVIPDVPRTT
jgi:hypothetical protein